MRRQIGKGVNLSSSTVISYGKLKERLRPENCRINEEENMAIDIERVVEETREAFESGGTRSYFWRRSQLRALKDLLYEMETAICEALKLDLGKHRVEAYRDEVSYFS